MLPTKNRRKSPERVSASSRVLARVVELKPATTLAVSRSTMRITPSSQSKWRSRSCNTRPARLFPVIEHLLGSATGLLVALADLRFDIRSPSCPARAAAVVQVGIVRVGFGGIGDERLLVAMPAA